MTANVVPEMVLWIGSSVALSILAKATFACVAAFAVARLCMRSRASVRHLVFVAGFAALLILPMATYLMPAVPVDVPVVAASAPSLNSAPPRVVVSQPTTTETEGTWSAPTTISLLDAMRLAWVLGATMFLVPVAVGLWQLSRIRRRALPWPEGRALIATLAAERRITRPVEVLRHEHISGPLTCGVVRPIVLMPCDALSWSPEALRSALIHELEHVRRMDWLTHCLSRTVCAIYWFHPLVWMAWRQLRLEAERACDDAVLDREDAAEYAALLITVAQQELKESRQPVLAMASRGDLSTRVSAVLDTCQARGRVGAFRVIATAIFAIAAVVAVSPLVVKADSAQSAPTAQPEPSFDVASVRPVAPPVGPFWPGSRPVCPVTGCGGPGTGSPERITFTFASLKDLIRVAYNVRSSHHIEAPAWTASATFDVVANIPPGATREQANLMLQNLLADRFQLKVHRSTRELPVYALVVARNGPKLKASVDDPDAPRPRGTILSGGRKKFEFDRRTMAEFARTLELDVDRPVIDMTGLEGTYDIRLEFAPIINSPFGSPDFGSPDPQAPELFTALTEQLGLRLESRRGPVDVLVVDSALRQPTEN